MYVTTDEIRENTAYPVQRPDTTKPPDKGLLKKIINKKIVFNLQRVVLFDSLSIKT